MNAADRIDRPIPQRLQQLAHFMDNSIKLPGGFRIGWDTIIGFVPVIGDVAGTLISGYIILEGVKLGASKSVVTRMLMNTITETAVGTIPLLGDLFDMGFKANARNVKLLERHTLDPSGTKTKSILLVTAIVLALLSACLLIVWIAWKILAMTLQAIF